MYNISYIRLNISLLNSLIIDKLDEVIYIFNKSCPKQLNARGT